MGGGWEGGEFRGRGRGGWGEGGRVEGMGGGVTAGNPTLNEKPIALNTD